jgi:hypothetical protein
MLEERARAHPKRVSPQQKASDFDAVRAIEFISPFALRKNTTPAS